MKNSIKRTAARRAKLWPALQARPRLVGCIAVGFAVWLVLPLLVPLPSAGRALVGWNFAACLYLALAWHYMHGRSAEVICRRGLELKEGKTTILALVLAAGVAVLLAVASQIATAKQLEGSARLLHLALAGLTVMSSWAVTQTVFTQHYAHDFYTARQEGLPDPLEFPGTADPDYGDFLYFACIIGTAAQTADVSFHGSALRRMGTVHCVQAFFFNTALLGLSINVLAGLL